MDNDVLKPNVGIMFDLETLSTKTNASIIEIGAVIFNRDIPFIYDELNLCIQEDEWGKNGRAIDGDTLKWWFDGDATSIKRIIHSPIKYTLKEALSKVRDFYEYACKKGTNVRVWGNGSTMDITILQSAYEYFGEETPWKYWEVNDVRTIVDLNPQVKKDIVFTGCKHSAVDDCKHEIKYLVKTLQSLNITR